MNKELKDQRVVTMMTPSELEDIDNWMFSNRIRSRGEAIRRLCQIGLALEANQGRLLEASLQSIEKLGLYMENTDRLAELATGGVSLEVALATIQDVLTKTYDAFDPVYDRVLEIDALSSPFRDEGEIGALMETARTAAARWRKAHDELEAASLLPDVSSEHNQGQSDEE